MNILVAEHQAECLKELKQQKDEYLKRLESKIKDKHFDSWTVSLAAHITECIEKAEKPEGWIF